MEWYIWLGIVWGGLIALDVLARFWKVALAWILMPLHFLLHLVLEPVDKVYTLESHSPWLRHGKVLNVLKIVFAPLGFFICFPIFFMLRYALEPIYDCGTEDER